MSPVPDTKPRNSAPETTRLAAFSAEQLFFELFWPWYNEEQRQVHAPPRVRSAFEPLPERPTSRFEPKAVEAIIAQCERMVDAARQDWEALVADDVDWGFVDRFSEGWTVDEITRLSVTVDPSKDNNDYIILCCEFGAALAYVVRREVPEFEWVAEMPYWESYLAHPSGARFNPFHMAFVELSGSRPADPPSERVRRHLKLLTADC